ncbi:MAG TPA: hypothetical protein EYQ50_01265 [Verrucomicrobiales bacterium]|nr:hypothetical protein [Verrucomicrobiales bacterium]
MLSLNCTAAKNPLFRGDKVPRPIFRPNRILYLTSVWVLLVLLVGVSFPLKTQSQPAPGFRWLNDDEASTADLYFNKQMVLRYEYAFDDSTKESTHETYKVFHHVFGPVSGDRLTKGPGGKYTHHRGMMVGWNKTQFEGKSLDFWHCSKGAHLKHIQFIEQSGDAESGRMKAEIHWNDAEGNPVIVEERSVSARIASGSDKANPEWEITWQSKLASRRGEIILDGDRQHSGFQFRAAQSVAEGNSARYTRPSGFPRPSEAFEVKDRKNPTAHCDLGWFAMSFPVKGSTYTVAYFADPKAPKPLRFSERPYGRFGTFFNTRLTPEVPLEMKYRLIITKGIPDRVDILNRYIQFHREQ